ncbi:MAG: hypothetical protein NO126_02350 [Sulfolobales archaeon]|nr:hypothetical protein [Sulfolobales archaeon]
MVWRTLLSVYYLAGIFVTLVPLYWWQVDVGGILVVEDSPFQISLQFLGAQLEITSLVNAALTAFRVYLLIILAYGLYSTIKGRRFLNSTLFAVTVLYIIEPALFFVIVEVLKALGQLPADYEPIFIGTTSLVVTQPNAVAILTVTFEPTEFYWVALAVAVLYPIARLSLRLNERREKGTTKT